MGDMIETRTVLARGFHILVNDYSNMDDNYYSVYTKLYWHDPVGGGLLVVSLHAGHSLEAHHQLKYLRELAESLPANREALMMWKQMSGNTV